MLASHVKSTVLSCEVPMVVREVQLLLGPEFFTDSSVVDCLGSGSYQLLPPNLTNWRLILGLSTYEADALSLSHNPS